ncbi:glycosyltransferase family protein [Ekhidna sp.]
MTKRVLLISPYFPPHNTIGTKRAINFVQGIHGMDNWEVIVLASKPFNDKNDFRLTEQIPSDVAVNYGFVGIFRPIIQFLAKGLKKSKSKPVITKVAGPKKKKSKSKPSKSLTPFDQYLWDTGSAVRNGKKLIKKFKPDVIWVNADPWSGFLVADKLSRKFGIPWVADLRDPWTIFEKKMELRPKLTANAIRRYERKFFESASKVVLNTETSCLAYKEVYSGSLNKKFTFIRNAFNEKLLKEGLVTSPNEVFTFGYYGGFRKFVPSNYLLKGFAAFVENIKLDPTQVKLEVKGNVYSDFWNQVKEFELEDYVSVEKEINLDDTIALLRSWDVLLLSAVYDFRWMISAKFYDYLFARKPILAVSDNDELNELISITQSGSWAKTDQSEEIEQLFATYYKAGKTGLVDNEALIEPYGLNSQAKQFLQVLNDVIS